MTTLHPTGLNPVVTRTNTRTPLGMYMAPIAPRTPAAEAPTIAWATTTGYSGEKSVLWNSAASLGLIDHGAKLEAAGAWGVNYAAKAGGFANPFVIEFWHSGQDVAARFFPTTATTMEYRVYVDGWAMHDWQTRTYAGGMDTYLKIGFSSAKVRLVRIVFSSTVNYLGLYLPSTGYVYPNQAARLKAVMIGDSYTQGGLSGASGEIVGASNIPMMLSHLTGWDVYTAGISATGYCHPSATPSNQFGSTERLAQLAALPALDLVILAGGGNDVTNSFTNNQITAALLTMLNNITAARPTTPIVVSGIQNLNSQAAAFLSANTAMRAVALAHPQVRGYIDWHSPALWISGSGHSGSPNNSGNADLFISPDSVHLTRAGAEYVARRTAASLARITV